MSRSEKSYLREMLEDNFTEISLLKKDMAWIKWALGLLYPLIGGLFIEVMK